MKLRCEVEMPGITERRSVGKRCENEMQRSNDAEEYRQAL